MNKKLRVILLAVIAVITVLLVTSCDGSPYADYDKSGYQVSVKYDANGGTFTAGTSVIVDTYSLNSLPTKNGKKVAKLITPDDASRGSGNSFTPSKNGYTFVGWYAKCEAVTDASGNTAYKYGDMWDFKNDRLELDPNGEYTSGEPVLTLYAAWVPKFTFEFYSVDDPTTLLKEYEVAPYAEISMPTWDEKSSKGEIKMYQFPKIDGKTFEAVYLDPNKETQLTGNTVKHSGSVNYEDATAQNSVMKLYIDTVDGNWYHIFNANQLKNISLSGNYVIENDIDLNNNTSNWAEYMNYGKFTGKLIGKVRENGEAVKISNITFYQSTGASVYATGLFGQIFEGAVVENISFENVTMIMDTGAPLTSNVSFGLLAGSISDSAVIENVSVSGTITLDVKCGEKDAFPFKSGYSIGLVCGTGNTHGVDYSNITFETTEKNSERLVFTLDGNKVELEDTQAK